ncbi:CPBP family intramembrane glutamic endopeptidase [Allomuricauda sp. SCSIO 65647]|uniref:CPBP family intramembrane glutamic endopeptidase n=1 Tax=Allomuricauda sp. SCSIO 65647 TaxID=2908843 RepID=UPI001F2AEB9B|nr:CPBP family intramembrane glutamic endopeptidase [Muricauda sp. SCSIO 65647]UJH66399.1 CPBP family intramembrane metalloprotease [Muricauda sp. SCSIO 65647]
METSKIKPIRLGTSVIIFFGAALLFLVLERVVLPFLNAHEVSKPLMFLVMASPHFIFFISALIGFRLEGHPFNWDSLMSRFRYKKIKGKKWFWTLLYVLVFVGLYLLVYTLAWPLVKIIHAWLPTTELLTEIMSDGETFVGHPLKGNWWLLGLFMIMYFFNVVGEEFLWRGFLFPKQEKTHGKYTWVVHGLLWTSFHLFAPYNAIMVLPGALFMSFITQRIQNNTVFLIAHAVLNGIPVVMLIMGIIG